VDNFYSVPALAKKTGIYENCVGTLCISREDVTKIEKEKKLWKVEIIAQHSGSVSVLKWSDKKNVTKVSTYHGDKQEW
jgi:hypothetical protein